MTAARRRRWSDLSRSCGLLGFVENLRKVQRNRKPQPLPESVKQHNGRGRAHSRGSITDHRNGYFWRWGRLGRGKTSTRGHPVCIHICAHICVHGDVCSSLPLTVPSILHPAEPIRRRRNFDATSDVSCLPSFSDR